MEGQRSVTFTEAPPLDLTLGKISFRPSVSPVKCAVVLFLMLKRQQEEGGWLPLSLFAADA